MIPTNERNSQLRATGIRFVRPEFQVAAALYAIHFAVWIPFTLRHSPSTVEAKILIGIAPVIASYLVPVIWNLVAKRGDEASVWSVSLLPTAHFILFVYTLLSLLLQATGLI